MPGSANGRSLRYERMRARVTQTALALRLGLARTALSLIENERVPCNAAFAARYREALKSLAPAEAANAR